VRNVILIAFTMLAFPILSLIRTVGHDGIGEQFYNIQDAINASSHGDTIIVYPGTYYENINYMGRNVTIGSFELTTGNSAYRDNTIIDGDNNGSCVSVVSYETNAEIYGFTIEHGSGYVIMDYGAMYTEGGGIRVSNEANFRISNCKIINNKATNGGGVSICGGISTMKGTLVTNNFATSGGGIYVLGDINFDNINRCSVYENYAGFVNDITLNTIHTVNVYLNIATVNPPTDYYIKYNKNSQLSPYNLNILDVEQGYRTEVNHDLYLSPNGNDDNDGFSFDTPKKSIVKALHTIASDSLNPKTIYLAQGIYSSSYEQLFPLGIKTNVSIIGDSISVPILMNQNYESTITAYFTDNVSISNLVIEHGQNHPYKVFRVGSSNNIRLSNITINPVTATYSAGLDTSDSNVDLNGIHLNGLTSINCSGIAYHGKYARFRNCSINDCHNTGDENTSVVSIFDAYNDSLMVIENLSVTNCSDNFTEAPIFAVHSHYAYNPTLIISDVLVANNTSINFSPVYIEHIHESTAQISNCTFVNNQSNSPATELLGRMNISNCIFDNDANTEVYFYPIQNNSSYVIMSNNLIEGYPNSVYVSPGNDVTFNEYNFSANPSFAGTDLTDPLSYRLNYNSPCIDAGTADTTGLNLPEFDLYGNFRIFNGIIDIGCNEWNGVGGVDDTIIEDISPAITAYPNPFNPETNIMFHQTKTGYTTLEIYNVKGQIVKTLVNGKSEAGSHSFRWNGKDNNENPVSSGVYIYRLQTGGKCLTNKMLMLK